MPRWVDHYGRIHDYLRISLTDRCNLSCSYCKPLQRPEPQPAGQLLSADEIVRLVAILARHGVRKLRFTGGEPTLRHDLPELIRRCTRIQGIETIGLTTNGVRYSERAIELKQAGLTGVNISLDSLSPATFAQIAGRNELKHVLRSVETAIGLGYRPVKINTVIMRGLNDHEVLDFVEWTRALPVNVRFIEYMPFRGNKWDSANLVTYDELRERIETRYDLHALPETYIANRMAEDFAIPGHQGSVSIIASMTRSFCRSCSRLRLTADGSLKACLFFPAQINLREALRAGKTDYELAAMLRAGIAAKPAGHPDPASLSHTNDLSMIEIGG